MSPGSGRSPQEKQSELHLQPQRPAKRFLFSSPCILRLQELDESQGLGGRKHDPAQGACLAKHLHQILLRRRIGQVLHKQHRRGPGNVLPALAVPAAGRLGRLRTKRGCLSAASLGPGETGVLQRGPRLFELGHVDAGGLQRPLGLGQHPGLPQGHPHREIRRVPVQQLGLCDAVVSGNGLHDGVLTHEQGVPGGPVRPCLGLLLGIPLSLECATIAILPGLLLLLLLCRPLGS